MSGENPMDDRTGDPGEFLSHPRWQRFIVALAGPAMNIMLAVALLTGVYMVHYEYPADLDEPAVVGWINLNTPAEKAGIQPGDKIVRVDDIDNPTWEQVRVKDALSPNQPLKYAIERGGKVTEKILVPEPYGPNQYGDMGWVPQEPSTYFDAGRTRDARRQGRDQSRRPDPHRERTGYSPARCADSDVEPHQESAAKPSGAS